MGKEKRTREQLTELIMREVRSHPDWPSLDGVAITERMQSAPHNPNWDVSFTMCRANMAPASVWQFATELQAKFDLVR